MKRATERLALQRKIRAYVRIAMKAHASGRQQSGEALPRRSSFSVSGSGSQIAGIAERTPHTEGGESMPLDPTLRRTMESRFGYDLSAIRVHTNSRAAASARGRKAPAHTMRRQPVF